MKKIIIISFSLILLMFLSISSTFALDNQTSIENDINTQIDDNTINIEEIENNTINENQNEKISIYIQPTPNQYKNEKISINDMNNPNPTQYKNEKISIYDMNNPNLNFTKSDMKITYFSNILTNIQQGTQFKVILKTPYLDSNNNVINTYGIPLSNKNITFTVNGNNYVRTTDANGIAKLNINLNPGQYTIYYTFAGSGSYQSCSESTLINVLMKNIIINPINLNLKTGTGFMVKVTDEYGNPVKNQNIYFKINNVEYPRTTNSSGIAKLNINFNQGSYAIDVGFYTNNMYNTVNPHTYTINVFNSNNNQYCINSLSNYIIQGNTYQIRLTDINNNNLANKNVYFCINSVKYTKQTDNNGIASITINLNPNNYIISTSYGTSTSQISSYEMITVSSGPMNMQYSPSDYNKSSYITTHTDYQCLDNNFIQTLSNNLTNGLTNELEKAVVIHNYVFQLNYKYNINGLNNAYN
ncbi:hypothetical protein [Methanobrevibacter sp.]|uniref:hypothetical protein n=1 Tax=Methanobrevibacter sp. TaxID=66852 RepID=UPI00388D703D